MIFNKIKYGISFLTLFLVLATGCHSEQKQSNLVELDLLSNGMPILIQAPADAEIKSMSLMLQKDITVKKGTDFSLQIYESDAIMRDSEAIKSRLLGEVKGNRYFKEIVSENENGFIYQTAIDTSYVNYGFRSFRIQGDKEYVFQTSLGGKFTLEAVQTMFGAVQ